MTADRFVGPLFRALNPVYARRPLSGEGARRHGGRFNRKGLDALYTALTPETAIREANQVGDLQPTMLVSYRADIGPVFDTRDGRALSGYGMSAIGLADPAWRQAMLAGAIAPTQDFADRLIEDGYAGLLVRSFARGADETNLNLVLWRWNTCADDRLEVIDDEGRLSSG